MEGGITAFAQRNSHKKHKTKTHCQGICSVLGETKSAPRPLQTSNGLGGEGTTQRCTYRGGLKGCPCPSFALPLYIFLSPRLQR
eukprot:134610-Pyramimonas_sp.AAC.1